MSQRPSLPPSTAILHGAHAHYLEQLSQQEFWDYAQQLVQTTPTSVVQTEEYLECTLEQGSGIIPFAVLRTVLPKVRRFTRLPASPQWMLGVTAWKNETIAVVDLAAYLAQTRAQVRTDHVLLIVQQADITIGFTVHVRGTHADIPIESIQPLTDEEQIRTGAFKGIYAGAFCLNIPTILTSIVHQLKKAYE